MVNQLIRLHKSTNAKNLPVISLDHNKMPPNGRIDSSQINGVWSSHKIFSNHALHGSETFSSKLVESFPRNRSIDKIMSRQVENTSARFLRSHPYPDHLSKVDCSAMSSERPARSPYLQSARIIKRPVDLPHAQLPCKGSYPSNVKNMCCNAINEHEMLNLNKSLDQNQTIETIKSQSDEYLMKLQEKSKLQNNCLSVSINSVIPNERCYYHNETESSPAILATSVDIDKHCVKDLSIPSHEKVSSIEGVGIREITCDEAAEDENNNTLNDCSAKTDVSCSSIDSSDNLVVDEPVLNVKQASRVKFADQTVNESDVGAMKSLQPISEAHKILVWHTKFKLRRSKTWDAYRKQFTENLFNLGLYATGEEWYQLRLKLRYSVASFEPVDSEYMSSDNTQTDQSIITENSNSKPDDSGICDNMDISDPPLDPDASKEIETSKECVDDSNVQDSGISTSMISQSSMRNLLSASKICCDYSNEQQENMFLDSPTLIRISERYLHIKSVRSSYCMDESRRNPHTDESCENIDVCADELQGQRLNSSDAMHGYNEARSPKSVHKESLTMGSNTIAKYRDEQPFGMVIDENGETFHPLDPNKYRTELCRTFQTNGYCRYGDK